MNLTLANHRRRWACGLLAASAWFGVQGAAWAQDKPAAPSAPSTPSAPSAANAKDDRALALLKRMSDTLAAARTLSVEVRGIVPTPAPTGQFISLFASSQVVMQRPDRLFVASRGDLFPSDIYYDGKTVTAISADRKFYARRDAAGGTLAQLMQGVQPGGDATAPFLDLLVPDAFAGLTDRMASALWVGQTRVVGTQTDHLAFTGDGVDWEIWIGSADALPRLMVVSYRSGERQPTFTVEFSDWKLNAPVTAHTFVPTVPKDAVQLEIKQMDESR